MQPIHIPENPEGQGFRVLPEGPAVLMLEKMKASKSKAGNPMIIATFVVIEEMPNANPSEEPTIGAKVVEFYSLQENAIFKIAQDYKEIAGESIPQGDYPTTEDFLDVVAPVMEGSIWDAIIVHDLLEGDTEPRCKIDKKVYRG